MFWTVADCRGFASASFFFCRFLFRSVSDDVCKCLDISIPALPLSVPHLASLFFAPPLPSPLCSPTCDHPYQWLKAAAVSTPLYSLSVSAFVLCPISVRPDSESNRFQPPDLSLLNTTPPSCIELNPSLPPNSPPLLSSKAEPNISLCSSGGSVSCHCKVN